MKKLFNIKIFLLALVLLGNISCNKWLELQPQDGITRQEYWKTKEQINSSIIGCYASLLSPPSGVGDRQLSEILFMWGELKADFIAQAVGISNEELDIINVNTLPTNGIAQWRSVYRTINYCNTVLDFAPNVLANDNTLTKTQLNAYLAEAHAIRALMYFYLVRSFRDVPLKITSTASDQDLDNLPNSSASVVLAQIVKDLAFAEENAVTNYGDNDSNKGRFTKYSINAMQADVYLWLEDYENCVIACDKIINSGNFRLIQSNQNFYNTMYYDGNNAESIFEFQYNTAILNNFYALFGFASKRYLAAPRVMDDIYTVDYNDANNADLRADGCSVRASDNLIYKWIGVNGGDKLRFTNVSYAHWIVYRYADVLLMKAEALNQLGNGTDALSYVYTIRKRANALNATDEKPDPSNMDAVAQFILAERGREFAFEGKRWYDVLRNARRRNYEKKYLLTDMVAKTASPDKQQSAVGKYNDTNSHYFPIYINEIQSDPNLVQNSFYK